MSLAYYNEVDPYAARWLRALIEEGLIAPGHVDDRSIVDVTPGDLAGYRQCHFFAGIGLWSLSLRLAGVPDSAEVWTGSCPCQPFSSAGKRKGVDDERHLFPTWLRLIQERGPSVVFGEQVASKAGRSWLGSVFTSMEDVGYAVAGSDLCAAGVGAPHLRQRVWWVAHAEDAHGWSRATGEQGQAGGGRGGPSDSRRLVNAASRGGRSGEQARTREDPRDEGGEHIQESLGGCRENGSGVGNADDGEHAAERGVLEEHRPEPGRGEDLGVGNSTSEGPLGPAHRGVHPEDEGRGPRHGELERSGSTGRVGDPERDGSQGKLEAGPASRPVERTDGDGVADSERGAAARPGLHLAGASLEDGEGTEQQRVRDDAWDGLAVDCRSVFNPWHDPSWVDCSDGRRRPTPPIESGVLPLAHGDPNRVGRLRAYGNAIVPQVAAQFIGAFVECLS